MNRLKVIWSEFIGLFVTTAASPSPSSSGWLAACWLALPHLGIPPSLRPATLFVGLVVILADSAIRRAGDRS
ncbi:hypothetical protein LGH83_16185 [Lichenihabitans sp. PAMC28606]|uniref:hypothetical protein n=1 Tax=Lichenihabitans sp. PAMC28606 TaxID=2880932 RepID=UPI001D0AED84|nr:hypothetical protein [Lichenihabitans sp. PAMC28606]UDL94063.1 hypothetical protein LGH83_16185 [Lichenihabitans sp. PAMC28606]